MADLKLVFKSTFSDKFFTQDGDWLVFNNMLSGVAEVRLTGASQAVIVLPDNTEVAVGTSVIDINDALSGEFAFCELRIEADFGDGDIELYKNFDDVDDEDYQSGPGYHGLEVFTKGGQVKTTPGYFYITNQEYYKFANMGVIDEEDFNTIVVNDYIPGSSYFVVPGGNIYYDNDVVKTPSHLGYDVTWENVDPSGIIPSGVLPSGVLPDSGLYRPLVGNYGDYTKLVYETSVLHHDVDHELIPSGMPEIDIEPSGTLPVKIDDVTVGLDILHDEQDLVITPSYTQVPTKILLQPIWYDSVRELEHFSYYVYVEDQYGAPIPGLTVTLYIRFPEIEDEEGQITTRQIPQNTNIRGVLVDTIIQITREFIVWAEVDDRISNMIWVKIPITADLMRADIFQLDNTAVIWDALPARVAVGLDVWGNPWTEAGNEEWKSEHPELQRPPTTEETGNELPSAVNGNFNIYEYIDHFGITFEDNDELEDFYKSMRVGVDGHWGQVLLTGSQLKGVNSNQCLNPTVDYYLDRITEYDGHKIFGTEEGSFNDIYSDTTGDYDNIRYVVYCHIDNTTDIPDILSGVLDGSLDFYFRGVALYPSTPEPHVSVAGDKTPSLDELYVQLWTIGEFLSQGRLSEFDMM